MRRRLAIVSIDDDPADVEILRRHLEGLPDWDVDLRAFADWEEGLQEVAARPPDAVLLDYEIGARTGLELLREIADGGYTGPVIMLTGHGDEHVAVDALQAGAADYLRKDSVSARALRRSLGNAIEKTMLRAALEEHRAELEEANRRLMHRNDEIRRFYQTLSHEMKTPLTVAREFVAMVVDGLTGPVTPAQVDNLRVALESCDHMAVLINDLLDVTRVETGKLQLHPSELDAVELTGRFVRSLEPLAAQAELRLAFDAARDTPAVRADEARLVQILSNLVRNAIKFTPEGGEVTVHVGVDPRDGAMVRFRVSDDGVGIPEGDLGIVFGRLFQSDEESAREKGGLGLGLHLCKQLVELHGGRIWCESTLGEGSTFHFTLPQASAAPRLMMSLGEIGEVSE